MSAAPEIAATKHPIDLSIVLPAYEEAATLDLLLPHLHQTARNLGCTYEILVIDAPSPRDDTPEVCRRHNVRYLAREGGALYGHAVRHAIRVVQGQYAVIMDADGSHNPSYLPALWACRNSADLVIASRYVTGGGTENPAVLIFMSLAVNVIFRFTLGLHCRDVSNSFRLYQGDHFRALRLKCNHFDIVEEILVNLTVQHPGYRVKEVPIIFEKRKAGKTKRNLVTFALGYLITLLRMVRLKRAARRNISLESQSQS